VTEHGMAALRALEQLGAVTAEAPAADADPEDVLHRAREVLTARAHALRDLGFALGRDPEALRGMPEADRLYAAIQDRAAAWQAALARARHLVGERVQAAARMRHLSRR
jgi:hypothetical protein